MSIISPNVDGIARVVASPILHSRYAPYLEFHLQSIFPKLYATQRCISSFVIRSIGWKSMCPVARLPGAFEEDQRAPFGPVLSLDYPGSVSR